MDVSLESLEPAAHGNDAFFKAVYSDPGNAAGFFKSHLPPVLAASIDWATLAVKSGSFIQSNLRQTHSDLLFTARIGKRETLLYLLFEHQTTPDPAMPLRLLGYILEILNRHHAEHGLPLPPVLPLVLHQGPDRWTVPTSCADLFDLPEEFSADLLPWLPKFSHLLLDLSQYDPAAGEDDIRQRAILQLMKLARGKRLLEYFRWLAGTVAGELPESLFVRFLLYAFNTDGELDVEHIYRNLSTNPELEKQAMTVMEKLIDQGRKEGRKEGREEGRDEGLQKGREEGLWVGRIQTLEEFLGRAPTPRETLEALPVAELECAHAALHAEYEARFKRS